MARDDSLPRWAWAVSIAAAIAGIVLAFAYPGTLAYWLSPLLSLPIVAFIEVEFLSPWSEIPAWRRRLAWVAGAAIGMTGLVLLLLDPSKQSYILAGLMLLPLLGVLSIREEEDKKNKPVPSVGDPSFDLPPDLPGD